MFTYVPPEYQRVIAAWQKAAMIKSINPDIHRIDRAGRMLRWIDFENRQSRYGWKLKTFAAKDASVEEAVHIDTEEDG